MIEPILPPSSPHQLQPVGAVSRPIDVHRIDETAVDTVITLLDFSMRRLHIQLCSVIILVQVIEIGLESTDQTVCLKVWSDHDESKGDQSDKLEKYRAFHSCTRECHQWVMLRLTKRHGYAPSAI
jgi:hypothetical protein